MVRLIAWKARKIAQPGLYRGIPVTGYHDPGVTSAPDDRKVPPPLTDSQDNDNR